MVPIRLNIDDGVALRRIEGGNRIKEGSIKKARWFKKPKQRKKGQVHTTLLVSLSSVSEANLLIRKGAIIEGKHTFAQRYVPEPKRCLRC